jgi:DNA-binding SARP family transcriptional activator/tetratricopeptide (TPR) repeat protein
MQVDHEFRVLGPIELWSAGQQHDIGSARTRCVLAVLLLTPGIVVPSEALIDRLWDDRPPAKARDSLFAYISRLRASLRQALGDSVQLHGRVGGYVLNADPETIDLHRFRRLRRQADALTSTADFEDAAQLLREADALWRGPALSGLSGDWIGRMRDSLEEEHRAALLARVEAELQLGRDAELVGELHDLLTKYPLDETLIACQMTALYRTGRGGDALNLYRETRSRLVEEQGTDPGPALAALHQRILAGDAELATPPATRVVPAPGAETLPPQPPEFVGRAAELAALTGQQGGTAQVSVIEGMPGVGKTALAVHTARIISVRYPDGVLYLNLHSHDLASPPLDADEALRRLLRMLTGPATQIPETLAERAALWRAQLTRRRAVVVLDDAARLDQIAPLLPAGGRSLVLITSRHRIPGLTAARTLTLDVLPAEDAVTLFRRIAGLAGPGDEADVAAAVESCRRLPLAIQLAAGRLARHYPPQPGELAAEMPRSPALSGAALTSPEWVSAFELSYHALAPGPQELFRLLGLSPCDDISVHAAAALTGASLAETERGLAALTDHHLLSRAPDGQFRFHDLIREYAARCAAREESRAQQRQAVGRLLDYYLCAADQAMQVLHPFQRRAPVMPATETTAGPDLGTAAAATLWLEAEWRNMLQAAHHAARHEWQAKCADLILALADFLDARALWAEALSAHTLALQACRDIADPPRIAPAALALSRMKLRLGRPEATFPLAEEASAIYRSLGDRRGEAAALDLLGEASWLATRYREALAYSCEAADAYRETGDRHGLATASSHSAICCWHLGRPADAIAHLREALSLYRDVGDRRGEAKTLNNLGRMQLQSGYHRDALVSYHGSLAIFAEIGGPQNEAILYHNIGGVYDYKGSNEEALEAYRRALAIYRAIGDLANEADVLNAMGVTYQRAESYDEALLYHQKAQTVAADIGNLFQQIVALRGIADVYRRRGRYREALGDYDVALWHARQIGDPYEEAKVLDGIAETRVAARQPDAARIALRQALDLYEGLGVPEAEAARIRLETMDPHDTHRSYADAAADLGPPPRGTDYAAIGPGDWQGLAALTASPESVRDRDAPP